MQTRDKVIVTTTINPPTKALQRFAGTSGWHLVVVGDRKTPVPYVLSGATYLSPEEQDAIDPELSRMIGWNCLQRRNFGFIWAARHGARLIATVDDDNIPYEDWGQDVLVDQPVEVDVFECAAPAFDPVGATSYRHLWHRGFPIQWLASRDYSRKARRTMHVDVQAGFWDGDPDIDAICRMEHAPQVEFSKVHFPLAGAKPAPFNSQNTILSRRAFPGYFLFPGIGRMDDIWAAYWLQSKGFTVAFTQASVFQERNVHDLTRDFEAEVIGYRLSHKLVSALRSGPEAIWDFLPAGSRDIYALYVRHFEAA
jgi:hypothetical protein